MNEFPRFIAVEGPVGVGKTTLARRLAATFNYDVLLEESPQDNPL
jgi:deoxyadenosine/deoxycytidine kinase